MRNSRADIVAGFLILILAVGLYLRAMQIHNPGFDPLGPAFMPELTLLMIGICAILLMVQGLVTLHRPPGNAILARARAIPMRSRLKGMVQPLAVVALLAIYIELIARRVAPFEAVTPVYMICTGVLIGARGRKPLIILAAAAIVTSLVVGYAFKSLFYVDLP